MPTFDLRRESCEMVPMFNVLVSKFENKTEQRRLKTPDVLMDFRIRTPAMTKVQMQEYLDFFMASFGVLSSFDFVSPFDDETYTVRFKEESFKVRYENGYFQGEFEFQRVFE